MKETRKEKKKRREKDKEEQEGVRGKWDRN